MHGATLAAYQQRQGAINAAMEARQDVESLASMVLVLASKLTGLPGPDAIRALAAQAGVDGPAHGLAVVRAAGHSHLAQQAAWQADAPVQRQASRGTDWSTDPDHSPVVMEAIARGVSMEELARLRYAAATGRQQARDDQQKRNTLMWETRSGPLHDDSGPQPPVQRSTVQKDWSEFPDHSPPSPARDMAPAADPSIWSERLWVTTQTPRSPPRSTRMK
jgi:hypothetical protein